MKAAWLLLLLSGCTSSLTDPHVFKEGRSYAGEIVNPYEWTLIQLADGPISGTDADDYSKLVVADGLSEAFADLDGKRVLFLRGDQSARVHSVLVFVPIGSGYRYIGDFAATFVSVIKPGLIRVYEACGGHFGFIKTYRYDNEHFVCLSSEPIEGGDGAPDENNLRLHRLFSEESQLRWSKVPNLQGCIAADRAPNQEVRP